MTLGGGLRSLTKVWPSRHSMLAQFNEVKPTEEEEDDDKDNDDNNDDNEEEEGKKEEIHTLKIKIKNKVNLKREALT